LKNSAGKKTIQVTAGFIRDEEKILITRRLPGAHMAGLWEFPGGKQEDGETLETCIEREIKEELGIHIRAGIEVLSVEHEYENKIVVLHFFECSYKDGKPQGLDGQEIKWVYPDDLMDYSFPPPDLRALKLLQKNVINK